MVQTIDAVLTPPTGTVRVKLHVGSVAEGGDAGTFERIYEENSGRVYAICLRMTGDPAQAGELTQDVFVHAWKKLGSFRGQGELGGWLRRMAINLVLNALRSDRRRSTRVESTDAPELLEKGGRTESPELRIVLERAIAVLPDGARAVFVMHDIEGYKHEEIARALGIAVGTAKAQLHRARKLLRDAIER
ncbi:MAG: RNA polymerase sigma factor [Gemmatimonadetes bacterium]|nr:RNA polymerase sigma factor [Gemmatimonadota bacterium]